MSDNGPEQELWDRMMLLDGEELELVIERETIEHGRTISAAAMGVLVKNVNAFIGTRVMRRWDATNEPPTTVRVLLRVEAA